MDNSFTAYTTSIALRDAVQGIRIPTLEVPSRISMREKRFGPTPVFLVFPRADSGFGVDGYLFGLRGLISYLEKK